MSAIDIDDSLSLQELKRIVIRAAAACDTTPASSIAFEVVVEAALDAARGRGAACVVHGGRVHP